MAHEPIPGVIEGGGTLLKGGTFRNMIHLLTDGMEGVVGAQDCMVKATAVPGENIRVTTGIYSVRSKAQGADRENYIGSVETEDVVAVPPNLTASTRYDLVVIQVENPYAPGEGSAWDPSSPDPSTGPYVFTRIISGVPSTANTMSQLAVPYKNRTALVLAKLTIPPMTSTIQQAHITDLRSVLRYGERNIDGLPETQLYSDSKYIEGPRVLGWNDYTFDTFPPEANWDVPIPKWATGMDIIRVALLNVEMGSTENAFGELRLVIGDGHTGTPTRFDIDSTEGSGKQRFALEVGGTYGIPASIRGTTQNIRIEGRKRDISPTPGNGGTPTINKTYATFAVVFQAKPEYDV